MAFLERFVERTKVEHFFEFLKRESFYRKKGIDLKGGARCAGDGLRHGSRLGAEKLHCFLKFSRKFGRIPFSDLIFCLHLL